MSDDWARQYIDVHKQRQQKKRDAQSRRTLAEEAAPGVFQGIKVRVRQDLKTFSDAGVLKSLEWKEPSAENFTVRDTSPSWTDERPTLVVRLNLHLMKCAYRFPKKGEKDSRSEYGVLQIRSDLDGVTQVYKNGDAFAEESEVSQFLLQPLLDFIDG